MSGSRSTGFAVVPKCNVAITVRFLGLLVASGCAADVAPPAPPIVRDSAGVRLVENTAPQWRRGFEWKLSSQPVVSIEANDEELETGPVDPVTTFILRTGEIIVLDGNQNGWDRGLVFDPRGTFVRHLGRSGYGPCEFAQVFGGGRYRRDSIAVHDHARRSITVMSVDGECVRTIPIPKTPEPPTRNPKMSHGFLGVYDDGRFLVLPYGVADVNEGRDVAWYNSPIQRLGADGSVIEPVGVLPIWETGISRASRFPQDKLRPHGARNFVLPYDSGLVTGENTRFEFRVLGAAGSLRFIARRPHEPVRITDSDKRDAVMHLRNGTVTTERSYASAQTVDQQIATISWPQFKPAYSDLRVDETGNFWLEEYRFYLPGEIPDNPGPTFWSVFDQDGVWLGRVKVPGRLLIHDIYDDRLIGVWKDDFGAAGVRVYRINKR